MNRLPVAEIDPFKTYDAFDLWEDNNENVEYFFDLEHLLTKTACFWRLASILFSSKGRDQRWIDSFHRYRRFEFPFRDRLKATHTIYPPNLTGTEKQEITGFIEQETLNRYDKRFEKMSVEDELIIYRSFKVRKGEAVRKGVKKLDNPDAHIQVEGSSVSYTMNIVDAVGHQLNQLNPFFMWILLLNKNKIMV